MRTSRDLIAVNSIAGVRIERIPRQGESECAVKAEAETGTDIDFKEFLKFIDFLRTVGWIE